MSYPGRQAAQAGHAGDKQGQDTYPLIILTILQNNMQTHTTPNCMFIKDSTYQLYSNGLKLSKLGELKHFLQCIFPSQARVFILNQSS